MAFILPGDAESLITDVEALAEKEFSPERIKEKTGAGAIFIPALTTVTAGQVGELTSMNFGSRDDGKFFEFDFSGLGKKGDYLQPTYLCLQQVRHQEVSKIKALLAFAFGGKTPSLAMIESLPASSILRRTFMEWIRKYDTGTKHVRLPDGTSINHIGGYDKIQVNGIEVGVGVSTYPSYNNTMRGVLSEILKEKLKGILRTGMEA